MGDRVITALSVLASAGIWAGVFYLFGLQGIAIASGIMLTALVLFFMGVSR